MSSTLVPVPGSAELDAVGWDAKALNRRLLRVWIGIAMAGLAASAFFGNWIAVAFFALGTGAALGLALTVRFTWLPLIVFLVSLPILGNRLPGGFLVLHAVGLGCVWAAFVAVPFRMRPLGWSPVATGGLLILAGMLAATTQLASGVFVAAKLITLFVIALGLMIAVLQIRGALGLLLVMRAWLLMASVVGATTLGSPLQFEVEQGGGVVRGRVEGIFTQPNYLGEFCLLTIFMALALAMASRHWFDRTLAVVALTLAVVIMGLTLSRGTYIGFFVGLIVFCVLVPGFIKWVLSLLALASVAVTGLVLSGNAFATVLVARLGSIGAAETNPADSRDIIWSEAVRIWTENEIAGIGMGSLLAELQSAGSLLAPAGAWHAHNVILNAGVETGLLGLSALLVASVIVAVTATAALYPGRSGARRLPRRAIAALLAGLIGAAAHGSVDFVYSQPLLLSLLGVYLGVMAAACGPLSAESAPSTVEFGSEESDVAMAPSREMLAV